MRRRWNLSVPSGESIVLPVRFVLELLAKRVISATDGEGEGVEDGENRLAHILSFN